MSTDNDENRGALALLMKVMLEKEDFSEQSIRALIRLAKPLAGNVPADWPKPSDDKAATAALAAAQAQLTAVATGNLSGAGEVLDAQFRIGAHDYSRDRKVVHEGAVQRFGV